MTTPARRWESFTPGHTKSLKHGAYSPRKVNPIAERFVEIALDDAPYLSDPSYAAALWGWARRRRRPRSSPNTSTNTGRSTRTGSLVRQSRRCGSSRRSRSIIGCGSASASLGLPVAQQTARVQRRGRYLPGSTAHPAKMLPNRTRSIPRTRRGSPGNTGFTVHDGGPKGRPTT